MGIVLRIELCRPKSLSAIVTESSTLAMSGARRKRSRGIVAAAPRRTVAGASVMFDLTKRSVTGVISSGLKATPGSPGCFGYR